MLRAPRQTPHLRLRGPGRGPVWRGIKDSTQGPTAEGLRTMTSHLLVVQGDVQHPGGSGRLDDALSLYK